MKVTKLKYQKKDPNRVNIYVDGKFIVGLEINDVVKLGLYNGQELTQEELTKIIDESEFGKLFNAALNFLSYRPRSEWEIRHKLKFQISRNAKFPPKEETKDQKLIDSVVEKLKKIGQINDVDFAKWFLDQRQTFRPMGERGVKYELAKKGVSRQVVAKIFSKDTVEGPDRVSDQQLALRAISKFASRLKSIDFDKKNLPKTKANLQRFLASRGFDWDVIGDTVEKVIRKGYNN